jgi:hypothetical protein
MGFIQLQHLAETHINRASSNNKAEDSHRFNPPRKGKKDSDFSRKADR